MRPASLPIPFRDPIRAFAPLAADDYALLLASDGGPVGRWSYIAARPDAVVCADAAHPDPLAGLAGAVPVYDLHRHSDDPPFMGGAMGLISYELAGAYEPALRHFKFPDWPVLAAGVYPTFAAFDHHRQTAMVYSWQGMDAARAFAARLGDDVPRAPFQLSLCPEAPQAFKDSVVRTVEEICRGEMFQANLSRLWAGTLTGDPYALWAAWVGAAPTPFAGYLRLPGRVVASNSPERFMRVYDRDGALWAETAPIKGTIRRSDNPVEDAARAAALQTSAKDRAENLMIVDLMRNDLSRVCVPGTVQVPALYRIDSFPHLHHMVSDVCGQLAAGRGAVDVLRAALPAGSVTGAPKIRACQAIADFEGQPRGPYCGALFWLGGDGWCDSSVLIRTLALCQQSSGQWDARFRVGGGITARSDPDIELAETDTKAHSLLMWADI